MRHIDMMIQKMKNAPKIRDGENSEYRAPSTKRAEDDKLTLQEQVDALVAAFDEHRTETPLDHPDGSVVEDKLADGAATDPKIGERTLDPSIAPDGSDKGFLATILSWFSNRFKVITGNDTWDVDPVVNLVECKAHIDDKNNPHETTAEQVPYNPGGSLAAGTVQGAIDELDNEKLGKTEKAADAELLDGHNSDYFAVKGNYPDTVMLRKSGTDLQASLDNGATWKTVTLL